MLLGRHAVLLAGVLPSDHHRLGRILQFPLEAFPKGDLKFIFDSMLKFWHKYRGVLPSSALFTTLERQPADKRAQTIRIWEELLSHEVSDSDFESARASVYEEWEYNFANGMLRDAATVLDTGHVNDEGTDSKVARGPQAMRKFLESQFRAMDRLSIDATPEAELGEEFSAIMADYGSASVADRIRVRTGVDEIDLATAGGLGAGQFWLVAAYAAEGKTLFSANLISYGAYRQGLNVVYLTGETLRDDVRRRFVVRHTRDPRFGNPVGVDYLGVKSGTLSPQHFEVYQHAAHDLSTGSGVRYGRFVLAQMPLQCDFEHVKSMLSRYEAQFPVHVLVVDSIDMVRTPRHGFSYREQLNETIEAFASLATSYAHGRGLIVVSPYQIKREAYEEALRNSGRYTLSALSETALAERRAYGVLSLLKLPDMPGQLRAQILKLRDGPVCDFPLEVDHRSCFVGPSAGIIAMSTLDMMT